MGLLLPPLLLVLKAWGLGPAGAPRELCLRKLRPPGGAGEDHARCCLCACVCVRACVGGRV